MRLLLLKELHGLKTQMVLIAGMTLLGCGYVLAAHFPDQQPFVPANQITNGHGNAVLIFAMIIGAGLLVRESEDGTLNFLDGLPVSRSRIFAVKMAAGLLVLSLVPLADIGTDILFGLISRSSIDPPFPWKFAGWLIGLNLLAVASSLAAAAALAFLRRWFALAAGTILLLFLWLQGRGVTWIEFFNPTGLQPGLEGDATMLPGKLIAVQTALAVVGLAIAWVCFCRIGARSRDFVDRSGRFMRLLLAASRVVTPLVWVAALVVIVRLAGNDQSEEGGGAPAGESAFAQKETRRYQFLFRESQRAEAEPILGGVDSVYTAAAHFFDAPATNDRIVVDLASSAVSHVAGLTNWTKIRVPLYGLDRTEFRKILGHETAHVLMSQLGGGGFLKEFNSTRFFNEGVATLVEERLFGTPEQEQSRNRLAAAVASRGKIPFETLCNNDALAALRDQEVVYPLGCLFGRAVVRVCGDQGPGRIVAEFKHLRAGLPTHGAELWREILQNCGYSLDTVLASYDEELSRLQTEQAEFLKTLPRLTAEVERGPSEIVLRPKFTGAAPGKIVCCVGHSSLFGEDPQWHRPDKDGVIRLPRAQFSGTSVRYMLGWRVEGMTWPIFEPWEKTSL